MSKFFERIKIRAPRLNKFDLSHERKFSLFMDALYPILVQEVVPGDNFRVNTEVMLRTAPLLAPMMHRVNVWVHYFFVPNRLVWDEWEDFITGGRLGTTNPVHPFIQTSDDLLANGALDIGSLWDFMGLRTYSPPGVFTNNINVSALPFRAYQLIFDEYYRDQNLAASLDISKASGEVVGAELTKILTRRTRCWEKDYFTSALPFPQRGPDVKVPIEGQGDVIYRDASDVFDENGDPPAANKYLTTVAASNKLQTSDGLGINPVPSRIENIEQVDMVNTSTMQDLRRAESLLKWLERNARGGARYVEQLLSHFGVISPDARLQRPEFLGGGRQPLVISESLSTVQTEDIPQANMAGHGLSVGSRNFFKKRFTEHGYVIGLLSVLPKTAYQQGIPRHMTRFDRFDYFWPEFQNIGEQEVKNKELYWDGTAGDNEGTFGYQSRYAEYKYACDTVHGEFKTNLAYWHMGRIFDSQPALNEAFVRADSTKRIFPDEGSGANVLYAQLYNKVDALRPMQYHSVPGLG